MFRCSTVVVSRHKHLVHMSTNGCAYPHIVRAYPHPGTRAKPREFRRIFSLRPREAQTPSRRARRAAGLLGVQHLPEGPDVPAEVVVLRHLTLDLLAAVQDRGVVA